MRKDGWTAWEVEHIARHGVTPQEVEELLMPPYLVSRIDADVRAVSGRTLDGGCSSRSSPTDWPARARSS